MSSPLLKPVFTVFRLKDPKTKNHRIIVSKKLSKKAVERNKIKRRVRSILQKTTTPNPLVIICRPSVLELSFVDFEKSLIQSLINQH